jgi:CubicO group peptidase (beta-lactamase class C family)
VQDGLPFAQIVVTKGRETVFSHNVGWADAGKTVPITDRHLCWCYSNTKVYTAVCLMRLVEAGKVALDDPVSVYFPEFSEIRYRKDGEIVTSKKAPTLRQLITMTSGLTYNLSEYPHFSEAIARPGVTTREAVAALGQEVFAFEPGTDYCYGLGHDVIAAVVEVASGLRFSEYVKRNLLDPLGIEDTGFHPTEEQFARFAMEYRWDGETYTPCGHVNRYDFSKNYDSGGAGLFSRPKEYRKLLTALACGGTGEDGYLVLKPETIDLMASNQLSEHALETYCTGKPGYGYGFGVRVHTDPAASGYKTPVGEFGWSGAAGAYSLIDRKNQIALCYVEQTLIDRSAKADPAKINPRHVPRSKNRKTVVNLVYEAFGN